MLKLPIFPLHCTGKIVKIAGELVTKVILFDVRDMAKELKPEQNPAPEPDAAEVLEPPKSYRMHILLGIAALVLFQTIVLAVALRAWFPPPGLPNSGLNPVDNAGKGLDDVEVGPPNIGKQEEFVEAPINDGNAFTVKKIVDDQTVSFSLVMRVRIRKKEETKFTKRYDLCKYTINDRIESMLAIANDEDRNEAGSTAIKARAKNIINTELIVPYVQEVLVSGKVTEIN